MIAFLKQRILNPLRLRLSCLHPRHFVCRLIQSTNGYRVGSGPFCGMTYIGASVGSQYYPKILGTYEKELQPAIEKLCSMKFDHVVNVGAGEGYYAVGFAMRMPGAGVVAFESDEEGRICIRRMAQVNGVQTRVIVHGLCDIPAFSNCFSRSSKCLVLMDVEGAESLLLDPHVIPELTKVHILVELHDFIFPQIGDLLAERFEKSHDITEILSEPRTMDDFPIPTSPLFSALWRKHLLRSMSEDRPGRMRWFHLEPRA